MPLTGIRVIDLTRIIAVLDRPAPKGGEHAIDYYWAWGKAKRA